ncbi:MAG: membrane protein insertion efficiency factor YidD [Pseudonocardiales bacterium]|nr:membrane protein insertion efficiency factor YidD [Pseudonocardiales bacterium]
MHPDDPNPADRAEADRRREEERRREAERQRQAEQRREADRRREEERRRAADRQRRAERRRRRREDAEDAAEGTGELVGGAGDLADLASGGTPGPGIGAGRGGGRGGGWCDSDSVGGGGGGGRGGGGWCDGVGSGGGRGGGGGCDGCDCNLNLLQITLLAVLVGPRGVTGPRHHLSRAGAGAGRPSGGGPRLSTLLSIAAMLLPHQAGPAVAAAVRFYRRRLTRFTPACPGTPSCSAYALAAVEHLGARRGLRAAADRLRSCGPRR